MNFPFQYKCLDKDLYLLFAYVANMSGQIDWIVDTKVQLLSVDVYCNVKDGNGAYFWLGPKDGEGLLFSYQQDSSGAGTQNYSYQHNFNYMTIPKGTQLYFVYNTVNNVNLSVTFLARELPDVAETISQAQGAQCQTLLDVLLGRGVNV